MPAHACIHIPPWLITLLSTQVEKHPNHFPHSIFTLLIVPSQHPPLSPFLKKILEEVNWKIKILQMGSWRSMIKQRARSSPHTPHSIHFISGSLIIETKSWLTINSLNHGPTTLLISCGGLTYSCHQSLIKTSPLIGCEPKKCGKRKADTNLFWSVSFHQCTNDTGETKESKKIIQSCKMQYSYCMMCYYKIWCCDVKM